MTQADQPQPGSLTRKLDQLGSAAIHFFDYIGGLTWMLIDVMIWVFRSLFDKNIRFGRAAFYSQIVRLGLKSTYIISLVSGCIGLIMVLQMAPPLQDFGMVSSVSTINAIAVLRELGPLISAIVLTGYAGASVAAELGTMVVGEEIEAMESMALNPVRFLVLPRLLSTVIALMILAVLADVVALLSGAAIGVGVLGIQWSVYQTGTIDAVSASDFLTGLAKAGIFGVLIGSIACYNGLRVQGGAAGVGRATTSTVVFSIVSIIFADLLFTATFYMLGWN
jgi:phospholipid/cholesterol/gamma-HCH transport system permease protein